MNITKEQSYNIQLLRATAIIVVVLIHTAPYDWKGLIFVRPFLNFGVGLFLFLSGMLSSVDQWKPVKRIKKIVIPYLIWSAVYVLIMSHNNLKLFPVEYLKKTLTGQAAAPLYYVFVYCELTILIPLIDRVAKSKYKMVAFLIPIAEIVSARMVPLMLGITMHKYFASLQLISCLGWFGYFYLGYLLGNNLIEIRINNTKLLILLAVGLIWQVGEGYWYYELGHGDFAGQLKLSAVFVGLIVCVFAYRFVFADLMIKNKVLKLIGDNSFGIYFSHMAIMYGLQEVPYIKEIMVFPVNGVIVVFASLALVLIGGKALGKYARYIAF